MKRTLEIFWIFFKVSSITLGGGYSMLPVFYSELRKRNYISKEDFLKILGRAQALPGPVAVNTSVLLGIHLGGIRYAMAALLGVLIPPVVAILTAGTILLKYKDVWFIHRFFVGVRAGIVGFLAYFLYKLLRAKSRKIWEYILVTSAFVLMLHFPIMFVFPAMIALHLIMKGKMGDA